jgi:hypothetical protein
MKEAGVRALPKVRYGNREYFVDERATEKGIIVLAKGREGGEEACLYGAEPY